MSDIWLNPRNPALPFLPEVGFTYIYGSMSTVSNSNTSQSEVTATVPASMVWSKITPSVEQFTINLSFVDTARLGSLGGTAFEQEAAEILDQVVSWAKASGASIELDTSALPLPSAGTGSGAYVSVSTLASDVQYLSSIGAPISTIAITNPLSAMGFATAGSTPSEIANLVASTLSTAVAPWYPAAKIGDVESIGAYSGQIGLSVIGAWTTAFQVATGSSLSFIRDTAIENLSTGLPGGAGLTGINFIDPTGQNPNPGIAAEALSSSLQSGGIALQIPTIPNDLAAFLVATGQNSELTVSSATSVIQIPYGLISGTWYGNFADGALLNDVIAYVNKNDLQLSVETAVDPLDGSYGAVQPGYGDESFVDPSAFFDMFQYLKALGGNLTYLTMDEPLFFGYEVRGTSNYLPGDTTIPGVASRIANMLNGNEIFEGYYDNVISPSIWSIFPSVQIVDEEPIGPVGSSLYTPVSDISEWLNAFQTATGHSISQLNADVIWNSTAWLPQNAISNPSPAFTNSLDNLSNVLASSGVKMGIFDTTAYTEVGSDTSDVNSAIAMQSAIAHFTAIELDPSLATSAIVFDSWDAVPEANFPANEPGTLTNPALNYTQAGPVLISVSAFVKFAPTGVLNSFGETAGTLDGADIYYDDVNNAAIAMSDVYRSAIGRDPDGAGAADWMQQLVVYTISQHTGSTATGGYSLATFLNLCARSEEAQSLIENLYQNWIYRLPTPDELASAESQIASGTATLMQADAGYALGSAALESNVAPLEGTAPATASIENELIAENSYAQSEVATIYQDVLGRSANSGEKISWAAQILSNTMSLSTVQSNAADSQEAISDINAMYEKILFRAPTSSEIVGAEAALASGAECLFTPSPQSDAATAGTASEATTLVAPTTASTPSLESTLTSINDATEATVDTIYSDELGRSPSGDEANVWLEAILSGQMTLGAVRAQFAFGSEATSDIVSLYDTTLFRNPTNVEMSTAEDDLAGGGTLQSFASSLNSLYTAGVAEVQGIYEQVLNRAPDFPSANGWIDKFLSGDASLQDIRSLFSTGTEALTDIISGFENGVGRNPTAQELTATTTLLGFGSTTMETVLSSLQSGNVPAYIT